MIRLASDADSVIREIFIETIVKVSQPQFLVPQVEAPEAV